MLGGFKRGRAMKVFGGILYFGMPIVAAILALNWQINYGKLIALTSCGYVAAVGAKYLWPRK